MSTSTLTFWQRIDRALDRIATEKPTTFDGVKAILDEDGNPDGTEAAGAAFFAGSGGDRQLREALRDAGWRTVWAEASYYYTMVSPTGDLLTYTEGDVDRGGAR